MLQTSVGGMRGTATWKTSMRSTVCCVITASRSLHTHTHTHTQRGTDVENVKTWGKTKLFKNLIKRSPPVNDKKGTFCVQYYSLLCASYVIILPPCIAHLAVLTDAVNDAPCHQNNILSCSYNKKRPKNGKRLKLDRNNKA